MNTPVDDFVKKYAEGNSVRLHVPGHKGKGSVCEKYDLTEIDGADVLYHESGILKESQKNASELFGTAKTLYSAEGSSLCIRAMLSLIKMKAVADGKKPLIFAAANAHKVFMTCSAILDIGVRFLSCGNSNGVVSCLISPYELEAELARSEILPTAVYITSPDYLGFISDIKGLSKVCGKYGVLLAVDNAHGAYLKFADEDIHPISLGAHICCDSAHKTFSVLTGGAYLHISRDAPELLSDNAEKAMTLFASTSPSYLILASLDRMNACLNGDYKYQLSDFINKLSCLKNELIEHGYSLVGNEPLKITIDAKKFGYYGSEIAEILRYNSIECEFSDPDFCVMMLTPEIESDEIEKLKTTLFSVLPKNEILKRSPENKRGEQVLSIKDALFLPVEAVETEKTVGRILASPSVSCPPAIPIAICGERLTENTIETFRYYGIEKIDVIKE